MPIHPIQRRLIIQKRFIESISVDVFVHVFCHLMVKNHQHVCCAAVKQQTLQGYAFTVLLLANMLVFSQALNKSLFFNILSNETMLASRKKYNVEEGANGL